MLETTILIAGGMALGGVRIALKRRRTRTPVWLTVTDGSQVKSHATLVEQDHVRLETLRREVNTDYLAATASLGLSMVGVLVFAPIVLAELPLNIYTLSSIIDQAYDGVGLQRRTARFFALGIAAATVVFSSQFLVVACIQWVYFAYRKVIFDLGQPIVLMPAAAT